MRRPLCLTMLLVFFVSPIFSFDARADRSCYGGCRVSRIPFDPFPEPHYFSSVGREIAGYLPDATPCLIWIVGIYWGDGEMGLNFPKPSSGGPFDSYINFITRDQNEEYLDYFDARGVKVWLQVEPGDADMLQLIDLVLGRYQHHRCVLGFGVDGEWFNPTADSRGRAMTDAEVIAWNARIKSYRPAYRLFLKHYLSSRMPPTQRGDILFIDDSQGFSRGLDQMVSEFKTWGTRFSPAEVGFQFGYPNDRSWWSSYSEPAKTVALSLRQNIPNSTSFFWVDFTIQEIFPEAIWRPGFVQLY